MEMIAPDAMCPVTSMAVETNGNKSSRINPRNVRRLMDIGPLVFWERALGGPEPYSAAALGARAAK